MRVACDLGDLVEDLANGGFAAGADVHSDTRTAIQSGYVGRNAVADVDEVARLLASAVNRQRLVGSHARGKDGHDSAFLADALARAVDVAIAQDRVIQPESALIDAQPGLEGLLAGSVRREGSNGRR